MRTLYLTSFILTLAVAGSAQAQGSVTSGGTTYEITSFADSTSFGPAISADLETSSGNDHLFDIGYWYRIGATGAETILETPTTEDYTGNVMTLTWTNVDTTGLNIRVVSTLTEPSTGSASVANTVTITNTTSSSVTLTFFSYVDFDVDGSTSNTAALTAGLSNPLITVTGSGATATMAGTGVDAFQVLDFPMLRDLLNDTMTTNLAGTGLPFGPDDFTGAYSWDETIAAGAMATINFTLAATESVVTTDAGVADAGAPDGGALDGGGVDGGTGVDGGGVDGGTVVDDGGAMDDAGPMKGTDAGTTGTDSGTPMGSDGGGGGIDGGGTISPPLGRDSSGCCHVAGGSSAGAGLAAGLIVLAAFAMRRRRRRKR